MRTPLRLALALIVGALVATGCARSSTSSAARPSSSGTDDLNSVIAAGRTFIAECQGQAPTPRCAGVPQEATPTPEPTDTPTPQATPPPATPPADNSVAAGPESNASDDTHPGIDFAISNPRGSLVSITRCWAEHDPDDKRYIRVLITVENDSNRELDDYGMEIEDDEGEYAQGADIIQPGGTGGSDGFTSIPPRAEVEGAVKIPVPEYGTLLQGGSCNLGRVPPEFIATPQY